MIGCHVHGLPSCVCCYVRHVLRECVRRAGLKRGRKGQMANRRSGCEGKKAPHSIIAPIKVEASSSLRRSLLYKETEPARHTAVSPTPPERDSDLELTSRIRVTCSKETKGAAYKRNNDDVMKT